MPGDGKNLLQPLWVEDLVTCLIWTLDTPETINQTLEVGGSEYFTFRQLMEIIMDVTHTRRLLVPLSLPNMRALIITLDTFVPNFPGSTYWLDYVSVNRNCALDTLPRIFGLMPARFTYRLDYLIRTPWYSKLWSRITTSRAKLSEKISETRRSQ